MPRSLLLLRNQVIMSHPEEDRGKQERFLRTMLYKIRELFKNVFTIDLATYQVLLHLKPLRRFPAILALRSGNP